MALGASLHFLNTFDYENTQLTKRPCAREVLQWVTGLHSAMVNSGAWDRLVDYDTETAQQLTILAHEGDKP